MAWIERFSHLDVWFTWRICSGPYKKKWSHSMLSSLVKTPRFCSPTFWDLFVFPFLEKKKVATSQGLRSFRWFFFKGKLGGLSDQLGHLTFFWRVLPLGMSPNRKLSAWPWTSQDGENLPLWFSSYQERLELEGWRLREDGYVSR